MTLTIIVNARQLSGELRTLINYCLKVKPTFLVINSDDQKVIDYFINHHRKHLTCFKIQSNLRYLIHEVSKTYQTQYYLALNSVDPEITDLFLKLFLNDFKTSNSAYGYLIRSLPSNHLFSTRQSTNDISIINQKILFRNLNSPNPQSIRYMISNMTLDYYPIETLVNRSVMIFGALGGIGSKIVEKYRKMGWSVIGIDLSPKSEVPYQIRSNLNHYYDLDLSSSSRTIRRRMNAILKKVRRIDHLIHAAGLQINGSIKMTRSKDLNRILSVNLKSIYLISQMCFPKLQKTVGSMVVINSIHAYTSSNNISAYAISKAALLGLVRNFAIEWGPHGIRVNGVAPGAINTPMLMDGLSRRGEGDSQKNFRQLQERHLMGRIGQPQEIADLVHFLGVENGFITGQTIIADGGASLILSTEVE